MICGPSTKQNSEFEIELLQINAILKQPVDSATFTGSALRLMCLSMEI